MAGTTIEIPEKLIPVFAPARGELAYRGSYGGRGSAKTRTFAKMLAVFVDEMDGEGLSGVVVCGREFMASLADSSMEEIKAVIQEDEYLLSRFELGKEYIRTKSGRIKFLFVGLRHNLDSLKSKARVLLTWIDEAENVSEVAWRKLIATVMREPKSEIWLTWNPESPESATHKRFRANPPAKSIIVEMNWSDNPWFPEGLSRERLDDLKYRPDVYQHVWEGAFLTMTAAQVFAGKYTVQEFEAGGKGWDGPYQGGDFGYSQDPTAAIRAWVKDGCLWIDHEAGGLGIELDDIPARVSAIPDFAKYVSRWDSAQPSMISHIRRKGIDRVEGAIKGKGSVEDGVMFIRSFKHVYIHPRCKNTIREFQLYSWKVDRLSQDILPELVDENNHWCIAEGQRVLTNRGIVPIEHVSFGDMVMTRKGWRKVLVSKMTNHDANVVTVETTLGSLTCTPDHPIYSGGCFVRADALSYGDDVTGSTVWSNCLSGAATHTAGGLMQSRGLIGFTSSAVSRAALSIFTARCGNTITGKYRTDIISTTLTKTLQIIQSKILNAYRQRIMRQGIQWKARDTKDNCNTLPVLTIWQRLGILHQKALKHIAALAQWHTTTLCRKKSHVQIVGVSSCQMRLETGINTAQTHVSQPQGERLGLTILSRFAQFARTLTRQANTSKSRLVAGHVLTVTEQEKTSRVYNLLVDGENEFIAEGILSHNCDALRYALEPIMRRGKVDYAGWV